MRSHSYLKCLYNLYNKRFFKDKLPHDTIVFFATKIGRVKSLKRSACAITLMTTPRIIVIQKSKSKSMRYAMSDLLHEMVHVSKPRAEHGKVFQDEMKRLAKEGAFEGVW